MKEFLLGFLSIFLATFFLVLLIGLAWKLGWWTVNNIMEVIVR